MIYPLEIAQALHQERRRRAVNHLALAADLCGARVMHLTPRMKHELEIASNLYVFPLLQFPTNRRFIFDFLWRLNPHFARPSRPAWLVTRWNGTLGPLVRLVWAWIAFGSFRPARAFLRLRARVAALDTVAADAELRAYMAGVEQDRPASIEPDPNKPTLIPPPAGYWLDDLIVFFSERLFMSRQEVMDTPLALLYQLWRAWAIRAGEEIIDPHRALLGEYAKKQIARARAACAPIPGRN